MEFDIRRIGPELVTGVAEVLAEAFDGYPWTDWTVAADRHRERLTSMFALTVATVGVPYGQSWAAVEPGGRPVAAAVWLRPDRPVPDGVWATLADRTRDLAGDRYPALLAAESACAPLRPTAPVFLLATVGVRPDRQGRGLGERVLRPGLAEADRAGVPAALETSSASNVRFYQRLGFTVTGDVTVEGGGPRVWGMRRPVPAV
ncbi:GCN5 family acetyltransferase [Micromonospora rosaria]|uniref:GCN5 family acetyltransferase n=1 Tax=Micromonospora rosaria TaxID=47874 RepID=A0A136PLV0_9ACTN|nr:GNAT family N-acetyltransferase [Micromonospora rosaria]KXK59367.1 GCN5 family acetyltransferase [Micromonospora rosaria]